MNNRIYLNKITSIRLFNKQKNKKSMTNKVLLNNESHKDVRVIPRFGEEFGENVGSVLVFPSEFIELAKEYAIVFRLNPNTQKYFATVLLGLEQNENLFLDKQTQSGWNARYIPAIISKGPFLIGFQNQEHDTEEQKSMVVHIDLDHPKASQTEGYQLFLEYGGNSPYLEHITSILNSLHIGSALVEPMFNLFLQLDIIDTVNLDIDLGNGSKYQLTGNYTINEDKLRRLNGDQLVKLNTSGFLHMAYSVINSMSNMRKLMDIKKSKMVGC
jgi:hypothetical protein